jgi:hypothetical protein
VGPLAHLQHWPICSSLGVRFLMGVSAAALCPAVALLLPIAAADKSRVMPGAAFRASSGAAVRWAAPIALVVPLRGSNDSSCVCGWLGNPLNCQPPVVVLQQLLPQQRLCCCSLQCSACVPCCWNSHALSHPLSRSSGWLF